MISVNFSVTNKSKESTASNLCISAPQSLDFRPVDHTESQSLSIGDEHEISPEETVNMMGRFVMLGDMRRDLHISCDLQYRVEVRKVHQENKPVYSYMLIRVGLLHGDNVGSTNSYQT